MFHKKSEHLRRLLLVLDLTLVAVVYLLVMHAHEYFNIGYRLDRSSHLGLLVVILFVFGIVRQVSGTEIALQRLALRSQAWYISKEIFLTLIIITGLIFMLKLQFVSRIVLMGSAIASILTLTTIRAFLLWWYFSRRREKRENYLNVLIVGSGARAHGVADYIQRSCEWGVNIIGFLDPTGESAGRRKDDHVLGHVNQIRSILSGEVVEEVIVAVPRKMLGDLQTIIDACQEEAVHLHFMADIYDFDAARVRLTMLDNIPLLSFEPVAQAENALIVKRVFELMITLVALPILLPFFVIVVAIIRLDSPGPALFVQERVGLHKRKFKMFKFRSMVIDAEDRMNEVEHLNEVQGPHFKIKDDPRLTRVGRIVRKASIDELPQLINVLFGDMSLVGPRPMSVRDVNLFDEGIQRKRFSVRPGITCIWQISGRSNLSFDDWLRLDLQYIDNWSLWLDLKILFKTVPVTLFGTGAS